MGNLLNLLKDRYSERRFDPEKDVEEEKLELLLEAARVAPTAHNNQAFHLYLLKGEKGRSIISNFNAPVHILITGIEDEGWVRDQDSFNAVELDIGIVGTHIMLEAEDLDLKSCMICEFDVEKLKSDLKMPAGEHPVLALAIGYPSEASRPAKRHFERKNMDELLTIIE
ncbi:MAG: nitroreductase [Clostridiaceae bacterium]|nr:nitroreductase [Clostridiaceae bacterium]